MATLTAIISKVISFITPAILSSVYTWICSKKITRVSIMIPAQCGANDLKSTLHSTSTVICNLDDEIDNDLDDEDKAKSSGNTLSISRVVYNKSLSVITDLEDILLNTSHAINTILYISTDYRLLKYAGVVDIEYFLPSDSYHTELMKSKDWDEVKYQTTKADLVSRKYSKLYIFGSKQDLQKIVLEKFPSLTQKI